MPGISVVAPSVLVMPAFADGVSVSVSVAVLLPAQSRMWRALERMPSAGPVPPEVESLYKKWFRFGGMATLLPLAALALMVFKPAW